MVEEQTPTSDSPEEVETGEGDRNVEQNLQPTGQEENTQDLVLQEINRITNRSFKSLEEAQQHYKHLQSFVGQNPEDYKKKAQVAEKLIEAWKAAGYTEDEALEEIEKSLSSTPSYTEPAEPLVSLEDRRINRLMKEVTELQIKDQVQEIINQRPEFGKLKDKIIKLSKETGKNPVEVLNEYILPTYEELKDSAYQSQKVKEETKISPSEAVSQPSPNKLAELFAKAQESGKEEDWENYLREKFKVK